MMNLTLTDLMSVQVTVASKSAEQIEEAPGIITIISKKEIESFAAENLGQILDKVVGAKFLSVNVLTDNLVVFRGQSQTPYNNHVLILLNGRPIRDPISGGLNNTIYTGFPTKIIENIEIIRGPGSVLYGSCAYSAVININTRSDKLNSYINSTIKAGAFGTFKQTHAVKFKNKEVDILIGLHNNQKTGERFQFADGLVPSHDTAAAYFGSKNNSFITQINYKKWSFDGLYIDYRPYNLGGSDLNWVEGNNALDYYKYFGNLTYKAFQSSKHTLDLHATYNEQKWYIEEMAEMVAFDATFEFTGNLTPIKKAQILYGGSLTYDKYFGDYFINGKSTSQSLYSQFSYSPIKALSFIAGAQLNKIHGLKSNISPRLGIIGNINKRLGLKLLYSEAYRKAYPWETSVDIPVFRGNLNIKPEEIATGEVQINYNSEKFKLAATFFHSEMSSIIYRKTYLKNVNDSMVFDYLKYENGREHTFYGLELESKLNLSKSVFINVSYAYQINNIGDTIKNAALHPNHMLKGGIIYAKEKWIFGLHNSFFSKPYSVSTVSKSVAMVNPEARAHNLLSLKLSYNASEILKSKVAILFALEGTNLLNENVRYPEYSSKGVNTLIPLRNSRGFFASVSIRF